MCHTPNTKTCRPCNRTKKKGGDLGLENLKSFPIPWKSMFLQQEASCKLAGTGGARCSSLIHSPKYRSKQGESPEIQTSDHNAYRDCSLSCIRAKINIGQKAENSSLVRFQETHIRVQIELNALICCHHTESLPEDVARISQIPTQNFFVLKPDNQRNRTSCLASNGPKPSACFVL